MRRSDLDVFARQTISFVHIGRAMPRRRYSEQEREQGRRSSPTALAGCTGGIGLEIRPSVAWVVGQALCIDEALVDFAWAQQAIADSLLIANIIRRPIGFVSALAGIGIIDASVYNLGLVHIAASVTRPGAVVQGSANDKEGRCFAANFACVVGSGNVADTEDHRIGSRDRQHECKPLNALKSRYSMLPDGRG